MLNVSNLILTARQQRKVARVETEAQNLAAAKEAAREATDDMKDAVFAALKSGVPVKRVAQAAGLARSLVYHWQRAET